MKSRYPSLVFPDTDIFNERQFPLLIFARPLYYLQPVEPDPDRGRANEHDCFIKSGLCQALTPAPLGAHRDRFVRLIDDIKTRKDDYAAQLSALILAEMGANKQGGGDEQRHRIVSSLIGSDGGASTVDDAVEAERWQARLLLAIAEILDSEELELQQEMQLLDEHELEMYRALQGDEDDDEVGPFRAIERIRTEMAAARPREQRMRLKAWRTLMSAAPVPPVFYWCASSADAADQIFIAYEKSSDRPVRPILRIPLPDRIEASPVYVAEQIQSFQKEAAETMQELFAELERAAEFTEVSMDSADDLLPAGGDVLKNWNKLLDAHFPIGSHGRSSLVFYLLPNCRIGELLNLEYADAEQTVNALLGVFKRA